LVNAPIGRFQIPCGQAQIAVSPSTVADSGCSWKDS
jgi:hypothetical protein